MLATCRSLAHCSGLAPVYGVDPDLDHCVGVVHPYYERGSVKDYLDSLGGAGIPAATAVHFALQIMEALAAVPPQRNKSLYLCQPSRSHSQTRLLGLGRCTRSRTSQVLRLW